MKKSLILAAILAVISVGAAVAQPRAIGANLGGSMDLSYQHNLGQENMIDLSVNVPLIKGGFGIGATATYDWINPFGTAIPWSEKGSWDWYLGVGAGAGAYNQFSTIDVPKMEGEEPVSDEEGQIVTKKEWAGCIYAGIVGHVGVAYNFWFPLQLSLDYRPNIGIQLGETVGFNNQGFYAVTLGVRYLF